MPRVSEAAVERNRAASRQRYRRNREAVLEQQAGYKRVNAEYKRVQDDMRPFIGWDSEGYDYFICNGDGEVEIGPQRTMLFGCSVPGEYITGRELSTREMLDLILRVESLHPDSYHVGFSFEYDVNQILKDLAWRFLAVLKETGKVNWHGYHIEHIPHKIFKVARDGVVAAIYDVFGFFHCKYTRALEVYGIGSDAVRHVIAKGKARRGKFTWSDIDEVTEYWKAEISQLPPLMESIREAAHGGGFYIRAWHGPGALASYALRYNGVKQYMSKGNLPGYVSEASRHAYAGGRFQAWQCGYYDSDVYTIDKNSAYIQAIAMLPRLDNGRWERVDPHAIKDSDDIARFGLYHIVYDSRTGEDGAEWGQMARGGGIPEPPYPLFHRDANGMLSWPDRTDGWYWSPEARLVAGDDSARFVEAIVYRDDGTYPFAWVKDAYETRLKLKEAGNAAEKAYKWALASIYGAFARRVGWDRRRRTAPGSHELAWAGYITSHCRAAIFEAAYYAACEGGLISVDTDGVTATVPFPDDPDIVPEGFGDGLGQWKQEHFSGIFYWQNGIYWLRSEDEKDWKEAKSRGVPKGVIPIEAAFAAMENASFTEPYKAARIEVGKKRYVGYRQGLNGQFRRWRVWVNEDSRLLLGGSGKGTHVSPFCRACFPADDWRKQTVIDGDDKRMHTVTSFPPMEMESAPHKLPWIAPQPGDDFSKNSMALFDATENEIFADQDMEDSL